MRRLMRFLRTTGSKRLGVNTDEASTVGRVFRMYAGGLSLKHIARQLNAEGVASPIPQEGRYSHSWCTSSVRVILRNERYRGKLIWNKTQKIRSEEHTSELQSLRH